MHVAATCVTVLYMQCACAVCYAGLFFTMPTCRRRVLACKEDMHCIMTVFFYMQTCTCLCVLLLSECLCFVSQLPTLMVLPPHGLVTQPVMTSPSTSGGAYKMAQQGVTPPPCPRGAAVDILCCCLSSVYRCEAQVRCLRCAGSLHA